MAALSGIQKVAIVLAVMGEETAARVMGRLDEAEQVRIGQAMLELENSGLDPDAVRAIVDEFHRMMTEGPALTARPARTLQKVMGRLHGEDEGVKRFASISESARDLHPFRALKGLRASDLARLLRDEHPQIQAIVLANVESDLAAAILGELSDEERTGIVLRMATMEDPPPRLVRQVARQMAERTRGLTPEARLDDPDSDPRLRVVADILNAGRGGADQQILERMEEKDQEMAAKVRDSMFAWRDLAEIDKRTMQKILAGIDTKLLALALKGSDETVTEAILGATSQRTRDMISEERELIGAVPFTEALAAQKQILATVRELMAAGEVTVNRAGTAKMVS